MGNSSQEATLKVGIVRAPEVSFVLETPFRALGYQGDNPQGEQVVAAEGLHRARMDGEQVCFEGRSFDRLVFLPQGEARDGRFVLNDVTIGIGFHWERQEDERFIGILELIPEEGQVRAVNVLSVEDYLVSVIASEMSATSTLEYLKAHAVISRSWLLSQILKRQGLAAHEETAYPSDVRSDGQWIKWWDREDHTLFDVCADDHCQRYQGITRPSQSIENVRAAVEGTRGQVLTYEGSICDARFSKCCGGFMETFSKAWGPVDYPYLQGNYDGEGFPEDIPVPDLSDPVQAKIWIMSTPPAFCNTSDEQVLSQVLNSYDLETKQFFRWTVSYTPEELTALVRRRIGEDFGLILELIPLERGTSGRISKLKIVGTRKTLVIGKELLIRKALSESHLYSSAFVVEKFPTKFVLYGAGWGHGVGFCQIGGAVMASKGYTYDQILQHYFPTSLLETLY